MIDTHTHDYLSKCRLVPTFTEANHLKLFTQLLLMTTSLKPRPVYKKQVTRKTKTMTEQTSTLQTLTKVQSHHPDVQLIDRNALWEDLKNRIKINNYEVSQAMKDLKEVVDNTHKVALPYVDKAVNKFNELRSQTK